MQRRHTLFLFNVITVGMNTNGEFPKRGKWPWPIGNYHLGIFLYQAVA